jgi:iron complex transport system ATP-binding protein
MTALMTMHNINTALRYADRCIFLKNGKVHTNIATGDVTPEIIHDVYGVKVKVDFHQENPYIIPII